MQAENERVIDTEYIKKYILHNKDTITIDYHDGRWIVENTSYAHPNENGINPTVKVSGVGTTLEVALDNFAYWYKISLGTSKINMEDLNDYF